MPEQKPSPAMRVSRRHFLHALAAFGGSAAVPLGFSSVANAFTNIATGKLRIGIALPTLGGNGVSTASLVNGLQLALAAAPDIRLDIDTKGSDLTRINKLSQSGADLIIGAVTPRTARSVGEALSGSHSVFLNVEPGAHLQRARDVHAKVFHHTLQLWQAHYATGVAAIARGKRAAVLSSFHEAGYDGTSAFIAGFHSVGGTVVSQVVNRAPGQQISPFQSVAELRQRHPDFIYINASGARAVELTHAVGADALPAPFAQTSIAESKFARDYQQTAGRAADAYALLGYESGQLILSAAADRFADHDRSLREALSHVEFASPRGLVRMQPETQTTNATAYVDAGGGILKNLIAISESEARAHAGWSQAVSGWSLPYGAGLEQRRA